MIELLPLTVFLEEAMNDESPESLLPQEAAVIARAGDQRRRQFTAGRCLAGRALRRQGIFSFPLLPDQVGAPQWPPGMVGSITHCEGYCAAAVAPRSHVRGVGIDAEVDVELPREAAALVLRKEERGWLSEQATAGTHWDRLLFSAKESVYKVWYPLTGLWLEFEDVRVTVDPSTGSFRGEILYPRDGLEPAVECPPLLHGRFAIKGGLIQTAVTLPSDAGTRGPSARRRPPGTERGYRMPV